jgi:hypothetical protein
MQQKIHYRWSQVCGFAWRKSACGPGSVKLREVRVTAWRVFDGWCCPFFVASTIETVQHYGGQM